MQHANFTMEKEKCLLLAFAALIFWQTSCMMCCPHLFHFWKESADHQFYSETVAAAAAE